MKEDRSIDGWVQDEAKQHERQAARESLITQGKVRSECELSCRMTTLRASAGQ